MASHSNTVVIGGIRKGEGGERGREEEGEEEREREREISPMLVRFTER